MKPLLGCIGLMSAMLMAIPCQAQSLDPEQRGKQLAEELCSGCHAVGPTGESKLPNAPAFRTLAHKWPLEQLEEALAEGIVTGHPDMPEFQFSSDDVDAFITYLGSINQ